MSKLKAADNIISIIEDWIDSFGCFAPYDCRWAVNGDMAATKRNIRRTKGCNPGFLKERLRILNENSGMQWDDIFTHETFVFIRKADFFPYSDERFDLILDTYKHCVINNGKVENPSKGLIASTEKLHDEKRCLNPNLERHKQHIIKTFDKYWGEGAYQDSFAK